MSDPSFLVTSPTRSDPSLAPAGRHVYYVLFPTPNMDAGIDWDVVGPRYRHECVARLEAMGYVGFGDAIEVEHVTTPADWAASRHGARCAVRRRALVPPDRTVPAGQPGPGENVVFAGSGTQPGVGVPMVLISGRLAAERILGRDRSYRSRGFFCPWERPSPRCSALSPPPRFVV